MTAPTLPDPAQPPRPDPIRPDPVRPDPVRPDPVRPDPVRPDPVRPDPVRPPDDEARAAARRLLGDARHGSLGVLDPTGHPAVSRVACLWDGSAMLLLVSGLSAHARALESDGRCSLLVGEPGRGDPLAHPRLTLQATAGPADKAATRAGWLAAHPKAALYVDFADFRMVGLRPVSAFLVAGFGRAHRLGPGDLGPA